MIFQGSNNVELRVYIIEREKPVPLDGATVSLVIKTPSRTLPPKTSNIIGNGLVSVILTSEDLLVAGDYYIQATVAYTDGRLFKSEPGKFTVGSSL